MPMTAIKQFLKLEAAGGIVLVGAAALAMIMANSVLGGIYEAVLEIPVVIQISKPACPSHGQNSKCFCTVWVTSRL